MGSSIRTFKTLSGLTTPRHPHFTVFRKSAKKKNPTQTTCRPIVSGNGGISENLSRVIDVYLQLFMVALPSFTKDTIHFLQMINALKLSGNFILVTIDVEALYCSIPHGKGLLAIQNLLQQGSRYDSALNNFILSGLDHILKNNHFCFDSSHYL